MNKKVIKNVVKTVVGASAAFLAIGEIAYEYAFNRKFTETTNRQKIITDDMSRLYGDPKNMSDADSWYVAMKPTDTIFTLMNGKTIHAFIFRQENYTDKWAIVNHGYTSSPRDFADQAKHFYVDLGYNVLMPSLVGFVNDEENHASMGARDKDTVIGWIDYIVNEDPDSKIVVLGVSMGSATTMLVTGEVLPKNVKCAVADCGYTSWWDEMTYTWKKDTGMGAFPVLYAGNVISKLRHNFDFKKCQPIVAVSRSVTPTLFIHGEKDDFVPYFMLDKVYNACTAEKFKLSVPDACHAESNMVHPELYYPAVDELCGKYMK